MDIKKIRKRLKKIQKEKQAKRMKGTFKPFDPDSVSTRQGQEKLYNSLEIESFVSKKGLDKLDYVKELSIDIIGKKTCRKGSMLQSRQGYGFTNVLALEKVLYDTVKHNDMLDVFKA